MPAGCGDNKASTHAVPDTEAACENVPMLGLFAPTQIEHMLRSKTTHVIYPTRAPERGQPITFQIAKDENQYLYMRSARFFITGKVKKGNTNLTAEDDVSVVNCLGTSLFSAIEVYVAGVHSPHLSSTFTPYVSYAKTILGFSKAASKSNLKCRGFAMDDPGKFNINKTFVEDPDTGKNNTGYIKRKEKIALSKTVEVSTPLMIDYVDSSELLFPDMDMRILLHQAPSSFYILSESEDDYHYEIDTIYMVIDKIDIANEVAEYHKQQIMNKVPYGLQLTRTLIKTYQVTQGLSYCRIYNIISGRLPTAIGFFMTNSEAMSGSNKLNPYFFHHNNLMSWDMSVSGVVVPKNKVTTDFTAGAERYMHAYQNHLDAFAIATDNDGTIITPEMYANGCFINCYDFR